MLNLASAENESGVISLRDYIAEQAPEKPYKVVCFYHTGAPARDFSNNDQIEIDNQKINNQIKDFINKLQGLGSFL